MKIVIIITLVIGALLVTGIAVLRRQPEKVVVIGEEYAKAQLAEQQRKQNGNAGKSPMPAARYDHWRGEDSLINPTKNPLDSELSGLAERFAKSAVQARADMRRSISLDEFYTLLTFSERAAVFAMREKSVSWVRNGLTAISMIEAERTDFRDILMSLSLLYHSGNKIGANADQLFRETANVSEPHVAEILTGFVDRPAEDKDLRTSWGRDEVETEGGVGFIGWENEGYRPSFDLKKMVIDLADKVAKDKYQPASLAVATDLPSIWLKSPDNPSLESVLKKIRAGATIHGELRPNEHPSYKSQVLMIFLVEMEDSDAAQELREMSVKKQPTDYTMLGVSEGKLFCLVVGRSFEQGVASFETPQSLQRFSGVISEVLKRYSKKE